MGAGRGAAVAGERSRNPAPTVDERPRHAHVRKASDALRLAVAVALAAPGLALATLGSEAMAGAQADIVQAFGRLPGPLRSATVGLAQVVAGTAPVVLVAALVAGRRLRLLAMVAGAAALAAAATSLLGRTLIEEAQPAAWQAAVERESWLTGRAFPTSAYLSGAAAVVTVLGGWATRRWREALWVGVAVLAVVRVVSGTNLPLDLAVALCAGVAVGSAVLLAFGSPDSAPAGAAVADALVALGLPVAHLVELAPDVPAGTDATGGGARRYRATLGAGGDGPAKEGPGRDGREEGEPERDGSDGDGAVAGPAARPAGGPALTVTVRDGDDRDRDLLYRLWGFVRLRTPGDEQLVTTVRSLAEREAFLALWLRQAGAPVPAPVAVGPVGRSAALVARAEVSGPRLADLDPGTLAEPTLDAVWGVLAVLRRARIAHRSLDTRCFVVDGDGRPWLVDVGGGAEVGAPAALTDLDVAHLLAALGALVGPERAVGSCGRVLGAGALRAALPYVQVLALPLPLRLRLRGREGVVDGVRDAIVAATGAEPSELARLQRIRPATLLAIAGAALALVVLVPQLTTLEQAGRAMADADWIWLVPALAALPIVWVGATVSLLGALPRRLAFSPTYLAQLAAAFLNRMTPNGVGGLGVNLRYLQRSGFDTATAGAAMAFSSVGGGVANVVLLALFVIWAGQTDQPLFELPDKAVLLAVFAAVLAAVGVVTLVPAVRRAVGVKVGGLARRTLAELRAVLGDPLRLAMVLGGSLATPLAQILLLGLVLQAFGGGVAVPALGAVYVGGHAVGSAAPTPGGLGGVEAALIAGLTGVGVESGAATSAVLVFRLLTYWLVLLPGWLALRHLRRRAGI
ncbi:MAG TPA: lysylphosphatidylglycerol synthase domain-containing protein [Acidimicrobiales bacterium]